MVLSGNLQGLKRKNSLAHEGSQDKSQQSHQSPHKVANVNMVQDENSPPSQHISTPSTEVMSEDFHFTKITSASSPLVSLGTPTISEPFSPPVISPEQEVIQFGKRQGAKEQTQEPALSLSEQSLCASFGRHVVCKVEKLNPMLMELEVAPATAMSQKKTCILKGSWADSTLVQEGDVVNILNVAHNNFDEDIVIDDLNGLLVVNPDHLVSGTSIVSSLFCMRKAVLNEGFRGIEGNVNR